ncbi:AbrB/MazE/SpoVT family DNA-binding domain-containing protein [Variovorax sp. M-6]|uniref:AbrB/MazE/SpoVT family DNA-binding domain-containing protein n=1 Tax=Variovorax sp. M-6 TaxID=3233041 RepID=UPI003F964171
MQVSKWGNSLAIRLPAALVKDLDLADGDDVQLSVRGPREFALSKKPAKDQILAALREFRGRLPSDFKFDRNDANDR